MNELLHDAAEAQGLRRRISELEKMVYVPGMRKCAKCGFVLISTNLHVSHGTFSANDQPEPCPNGCGPLWRVSERDAGNKMVDRCDHLADEIKRLTTALAVTAEEGRTEIARLEQKCADLEAERNYDSRAADARLIAATGSFVASLRDAYTALAFAHRRIHSLPRSQDTELARDIEKVRAGIERAMKEAGITP